MMRIALHGIHTERRTPGAARVRFTDRELSKEWAWQRALEDA